MRSAEEIRAQLIRIEEDDRLHYPTATVWENAPLALIQTNLEARRDVLRWVLSDGEEKGRDRE